MSDHSRWIESGQAMSAFRERVIRISNEGMRERYLGSDANIGSEILRMRKKALSSANLFTLRQKWSPISWESKPGLSFEIAEISMRSLGESALDPEIDDIVMDATLQALGENSGDVMKEIVFEALHGSVNFEVKDA